MIDDTVIDGYGGGPVFCGGLIESVLTGGPPSCVGHHIVGLDWSAISAKTVDRGVTYAQLHLVGTFSNSTLTLTQPATSTEAHTVGPTGPAVSTPCPDPRPTAGPRTTDVGPLFTWAAHQPDIAGIWMDGKVVNLAFTADIARHENEARQLWDGPLCVTKQRHTKAELQAIKDGMEDPTTKAAGVDATYVFFDDVSNVVSAHVVIADAYAQYYVDHRFGPGTVRLFGLLTPVN